MNNKLAFPVNYVGITQGYSNKHQAIDLGWHTTPNEPILACFSGVVSNIYTDEKFGGGLTLSIKYDNGYSSDFKHLSKTLKNVGDRVSQLEQVAIMGNSGWASSGTHLHFNLYKNGGRVNPLEHCYLYPNQEVSNSDKEKVLYYKEEPTTNLKIGDKVIVNGYLYVSSNANDPSGRAVNKETVITRIAENAQHPYNTTGDLGWMDADDVKLCDENTIYIVQKGDTLSSIAKKYNTTWQKIYEDNKDVIGDNPNLIKPGQKLKIN